MAAAAVAGGDSLQAEAFQRLYPAEFLRKFVTEGVRPDGRPLGRARCTFMLALPNHECSRTCPAWTQLDTA